MYAEHTQPQLTFLAIVPWVEWPSLSTPFSPIKYFYFLFFSIPSSKKMSIKIFIFKYRLKVTGGVISNGMSGSQMYLYKLCLIRYDLKFYVYFLFWFLSVKVINAFLASETIEKLSKLNTFQARKSSFHILDQYRYESGNSLFEVTCRDLLFSSEYQ